MGWLAENLPQANLYISVQGSAERSMEERSSPGRGISAMGGAGAGAGWARQEVEPASAAVATIARTRWVCRGAVVRGVSIMLSSPCGEAFGAGKRELRGMLPKLAARGSGAGSVGGAVGGHGDGARSGGAAADSAGTAGVPGDNARVSAGGRFGADRRLCG